MKSLTTLTNLFTSLANNVTPTNTALGQQLINDQHRYLIQKYFDNERTVTTTTIGGMHLTLTAPPALGTTTGTLSATWTYPTCHQLVTFSDGEQYTGFFTNGSAAISWTTPLTSSTVTASISTVGVQDYAIPANISKIKNNTINVGQLKYQPVPIMTRQEWDTVNFLPYTSDIPNYFYIYNGNLSIWPIPSTTGNVLTFNYQTRVADLSFTDYTTGTLAATGMVAGSTAVTGLATSWLTTGGYPSGVDIGYYNLKIRANPPFGDGIWYPILKFNSDTSLTLGLPVVNAPNITAATTYTIGQFPLLEEDFHDMLVYGSLKTYYTAITEKPDKFKEFDSMYAERLQLLEAYAGTKSVNVDLGDQPQAVNPNLFLYAP